MKQDILSVINTFLCSDEEIDRIAIQIYDLYQKEDDIQKKLIHEHISSLLRPAIQFFSQYQPELESKLPQKALCMDKEIGWNEQLWDVELPDTLKALQQRLPELSQCEVEVLKDVRETWYALTSSKKILVQLFLIRTLASAQQDIELSQKPDDTISWFQELFNSFPLRLFHEEYYYDPPVWRDFTSVPLQDSRWIRDRGKKHKKNATHMFSPALAWQGGLYWHKNNDDVLKYADEYDILFEFTRCIWWVHIETREY